jgi:thiamine biosynthesis lipoprotein
MFIIVLYAPDEEVANEASDLAFSRIRNLDQILSDYDFDSELCRLSRAAPTVEPVVVSEDLWIVLQKAQELSVRSRGAFDVTVGPYTKLWRRARRRRTLPDPAQLKEAKAAVGYQSLRLDGKARAVTLARPGMRLDLGGIAKGYAVDRALAELTERGIKSAMVNASGDLAASSPPPGKPGWLVGIAPLEPKARPSVFGYLADQAIATSGDAFQFVEIDGQRYSHIVDPRTGYGLTQRSSVSVLAADCTTADGLASAASVLGPKEGLQLVDSIPGAEALIVAVEQDRVVTRQTPRFREWVVPRK